MSWEPKKWPCGHPKYPSQTFCWDCGKDSKQSPSRTRTPFDESRTRSEGDLWPCGHAKKAGTTTCWECTPVQRRAQAGSGISEGMKILILILLGVPLVASVIHFKHERKLALHRASYPPCEGTDTESSYASYKRILDSLARERAKTKALHQEIEARAGYDLNLYMEMVKIEDPNWLAREQVYTNKLRDFRHLKKCYGDRIGNWIFKSGLLDPNGKEAVDYYCDSCRSVVLRRWPDYRKDISRLRKN